jgi:proteasome assembly chaperone 3
MITPLPPPSVELTPLLGHPPTPELHTFYNLLAAQLSTIVWCLEGGGDGSFGLRRTIVVGIALKQNQDLETLYKSLVDALVKLLGNN